MVVFDMTLVKVGRGNSGAYSLDIIIIRSTVLGGPWPPQANVASDLYPGHLPASF